jgi:hypothetical protein
MKRSATLLPGEKAARIDKVHPDQSNTTLEDDIVVFQRLIDLGSATSNVLQELSAAGRIGIQIVELINVRPYAPFFRARLTNQLCE